MGLSKLLLPDEKFHHIAIGVADIQLQNAITSRSWSTDDCNVMGSQVPLRLLQVVYLEGNVSAIAAGLLISAIAGLYLGSPARLGLTDQVKFGAALTEPGAREVEIARAGNLLHAQYLAIKTA